jgi:tRNA A37 methylthiotransferase MiaB
VFICAAMNRPVWLFSMDTEQFSSPPMTTGALKASFLAYGRSADRTDVNLVHFARRESIAEWVASTWHGTERTRAREAVAAGLTPVLGFSCYTWNVAEFLELIRELRASCPGVLVIVGGPHVQQPEDFLHGDGIDVIALGEAEMTFAELLDCRDRSGWNEVAGLAFLDDTKELVRTAPRERERDLDRFPSALDVVPLRDDAGKALYERAAIETTRGCPFKCAFCEWGTGAIGTKMYQFSLERFRDSVERLIAGGIQDIWLCDSNFGALAEDVDKAKILVEVRQRTGMPSTFATSWHKHHNARVQEIVLLMHKHDMLQHYNLALQTLTPLALELSHRKNMRSNQYEPIAKQMAEEGISIATELIWGLPGDNLADFESHLDRLAAIFPNINIFGYTLLPGTEFYARRAEYEIDAIPVAGYGRAKGEYVVGCHTFSRDEGIEGYFLISAHIVLIRGYVIPLTARLLALRGNLSVSAFLRAALRALAREFQNDIPHLDLSDRMTVYESRAELYLAMLRDEERAFDTIAGVLQQWLAERGCDEAFVAEAARVLRLDRAFCPRVGQGGAVDFEFDFAADRAAHHLGRMELPPSECFAPQSTTLRVQHPGAVGEVLLDPDGGSWMRGQVAA